MIDISTNKNTIVLCVYTPGGDYTEEHVALLKKQIPEILCLGTDIPLKNEWLGWWAKMELFRPDIKRDILFFDLDTIITGGIEKYKTLSKTHVLSDFFYPEISIGSGMMFIKHEDKAEIWKEWTRDYKSHISRFRGDQNFLNQFLMKSKKFQDVFPGEILSYKKNLVQSCQFYDGQYQKEDANVICFHGTPRPWDAGEKWVKQFYKSLRD